MTSKVPKLRQSRYKTLKRKNKQVKILYELINIKNKRQIKYMVILTARTYEQPPKVWIDLKDFPTPKQNFRTAPINHSYMYNDQSIFWKRLKSLNAIIYLVLGYTLGSGQRKHDKATIMKQINISSSGNDSLFFILSPKKLTGGSLVRLNLDKTKALPASQSTIKGSPPIGAPSTLWTDTLLKCMNLPFTTISDVRTSI